MKIMSVRVHCVYGADHIDHVRDVLVPSLASSADCAIEFCAINYDAASDALLENTRFQNVSVVNVSNDRGGTIGFAEAHNALARTSTDAPFFIIINPDCIAQPGSIEALVDRFNYNPTGIGIVEGRQWPFEHPKEYDPDTGATPWASGAFALINTAAYGQIGGMDENYFLYIEDVDLSWRMWLAGFEVIYEPKSAVAHFSGGPFYRDDLVENEKYFGLRNFLLIMRKFWGEEGEERARKMLVRHGDKEIVSAAFADVDANFRHFHPLPGRPSHPLIKVCGVGLFHEIRK
ncbi:hypothetical protein [Terrihabitans sp. B22-R8]|uniref:hypothetical protein n=1 Tax=Terrihabitans sp. B22-R8 TaxID=3425128 RepID=UPI00403C7892